MKKHAAKAVGLTSAHEAQKEDYERVKLGTDNENGSEPDVNCDEMTIDLKRDAEIDSEGRKKRRRINNEDMVRIRRQILSPVVLNSI